MHQAALRRHMRLRIISTTVIDTTTGEVQTKAVWHIEGQDENLGSAMHQAAAALTRLTPPPVVTQSESLDEPRDHPAAREARILGGMLEIRSDVEQALGTRPAGRVLEVLKWIRTHRASNKIRSVPSLFWSLVNKD
jgi:hypothetical protein